MHLCRGWALPPFRAAFIKVFSYNRDTHAFRRLDQPHAATLIIMNNTSSEVMNLLI
jgi:hypothetical protein